MYRKQTKSKQTLAVSKSYEGEWIEEKVNRIANNKEPIRDGAPLVYTERKDGVLPDYNIRTDRFEVAVEAMDKIHKSQLAKREARLKAIREGNDQKDNNNVNENNLKAVAGGKPIEGTN